MSSQLPPLPADVPHGPSPYLRDTYVFEWRNLSLRTDIVFMIAIALCLSLGLAVGHPGAGMIAAGGAMTVGMGAKQSIDDSRLKPMIFVSLSMAFSTFVGMVAGHEGRLLVLFAALWGLGHGMLSNRSPGYVWVSQQSVVTLLVASAFPFSPGSAAIRASLILAGGAVQILFTSLLLRLNRQLQEDLLSLARYAHTEEFLLRAAIVDTARALRPGKRFDPTLAYALRLAVTLGVGTAIYVRVHFASGYWIPMTAFLVLRPGLTDTASRAIARTAGTLAGAILVSFFVAHLTPAPALLAALTVLFAWLSFGSLNVNYALFSVFLTGYIVFLLSVASIPGTLTAERRAVSTMIGGAIALAVRLIVLHHRRKAAR
ncbi:MAG TPA: FUSC family protein [Acidobacteriaceae bacterium]|nr:FUSC family protein [Acidobacteriaceae bacterium]